MSTLVPDISGSEVVPNTTLYDKPIGTIKLTDINVPAEQLTDASTTSSLDLSSDSSPVVADIVLRSPDAVSPSNEIKTVLDNLVKKRRSCYEILIDLIFGDKQ
jgi:hypothetical protein